MLDTSQGRAHQRYGSHGEQLGWRVRPHSCSRRAAGPLPGLALSPPRGDEAGNAGHTYVAEGLCGHLIISPLACQNVTGVYGNCCLDGWQTRASRVPNHHNSSAVGTACGSEDVHASHAGNNPRHILKNTVVVGALMFSFLCFSTLQKSGQTRGRMQPA